MTANRTSLCETCCRIPTRVFQSHAALYDDRRKLLEFRAPDLLMSAPTCSFCSLVLNAVSARLQAQNAGPKSSQEVHDLLQTVEWWQTFHVEQNQNIPKDVRSPKMTGFVTWTHSNLTPPVAISLQAFGLPGSAASLSASVPEGLALNSSDCKDAFQLSKGWLKTCLLEHKRCRQTLCGTNLSETEQSEMPHLPSRIIQICSVQQGESHRRMIFNTSLVESEGMRGRWVALSHCWGPSRRHPLKTTKGNLHAHRDCIPWPSLPQTFRDAIKIAYMLGVEFIWIDSLCIVQDDLEDWKTESSSMGYIYENAILTIAASGAGDSTEGCFLNRDKTSQAMEVPFPTKEDARGGSFFILPKETTGGPDSSVLNTRAWATQEWILSRRIIHYMRDSMIWSCKTLTQTETGRFIPIRARNNTWAAIVEEYSNRELTLVQDKLIALEGLASEISKTRPDKYWFGLWSGDIPDQLFWFARSKLGKIHVADVPSWSWASRMGAVRFLPFDMEGGGWPRTKPLSRKLCGTSTLEDNRYLCLSGLLKVVPALAKTTDQWSRNAFSTYTERIYRGPLYDIRSEAEEGIGWCVLDAREVPTKPLLCFALVQDYVGDYDEGRFFFYKVLILQAGDPIGDCYERVGAGCIFTSSWFADVETKSIRIA
ncbi:HET-domain-containing protein [Lophium mytilinum]|uniref:HET-domain-containing protein n=1 Tax=Lophium mytilinum TaxID=390894 RepID=A0A6A6R1A8_9PEZI|nr:HET-domain-containing protein [Lophium mytilinum]